MNQDAPKRMSNRKLAAILSGIGIAGTAALLFIRSLVNKAYDISRLRKLCSRMEAIPTARIHSMDFSGLTIRIDVSLKNPVNRGLKMSYPFFTVKYKGQLLGSSDVIDKQIAIPPNGQANIVGVMLNFPLIGMLSLAAELFRALQSGAEVKLDITTATTVDPLWKVDPSTKAWKKMRDFGITAAREIPYSMTKQVFIKKATV